MERTGSHGFTPRLIFPRHSAHGYSILESDLSIPHRLKPLSWQPMHGFEITSWLEERSAGTLEFDESAVYQALYRMEEKWLIKAEWGVTEANRRARYYRLLPAGRKHLAAETGRLLRYAELLSGILSSAPKPA
ncbi:MAG: helix-turn-helix transcriptional regulator [Longimicrobiales bacterium]